MTDRQALDAALTYFRSRGLIHGDAATTHAATLLVWANEVQQWVVDVRADTQAEVEAARRSVARADAVRVAVGRALDGQPEALADFVGAVARLLDGADTPAEPALTGGVP